ncbi:phospholipase-like protein [Tanacetum coccineum]
MVVMVHLFIARTPRSSSSPLHKNSPIKSPISLRDNNAHAIMAKERYAKDDILSLHQDHDHGMNHHQDHVARISRARCRSELVLSRNEVYNLNLTLLSAIRHENLFPLLGYSFRTSLANGSVSRSAILKIEAPDLYVRQSPVLNAYTLAINGKKPIVVVHTSLIALLSRKELQAILAHELGHLKCSHGVYMTVANTLVVGAYSIPLVDVFLNCSIFFYELKMRTMEKQGWLHLVDLVSRQWILPSKHHCTRVLLGEPFTLQIFCLKKVLGSMQLIYMDIYMPIVGKEAFLLGRHGGRKLQQLVEQMISLSKLIPCLDAQDDTFLQDDQGREKCMEQHNGMCGDTEDVNDGDGVLDSQTKDVIEEAAMLPTMSSHSPQAGNAAVSEFFTEFDALKKEVLLIKKRKDDKFDELTKRFSKLETSKTFVKFKKLLTNDLCTKNESSDCNPKKYDGGVSIEEKPNFSSYHNDSSNHIGGVSSKASSSSAHPGNDKDVSHLDDNMEIDGPNAKDRYSNTQHHLHLLIKALGTKIEMVIPPKVNDPMLRTIKPKDDFDEADVDSYDDDYMSLFNDEEQPAKSLLNDMELQQEPDIVDVKDWILEQQENADKGKNNCWLTDQHLDLWIDLMRSLRPTEADWAIVSPHFLTCILNGMMQDYFSNGHMYPLPWIAVEKVYFLVNEPKKHWCLAQLEIRTGVVTFYIYLVGLVEVEGGISADHYKITYNYAAVPFQASLYGDFPAFNSQPKSDKILLGFGVRPDTLDPTIIKVSHPCGGHGSWYVFVFTLSSMNWKKLDNNILPKESIRFKCSSQVVVGRLIFWVGHERFVSDDGHVVFKKHLLVSFDLIGHSFQVHDIDVVFRDGLTVLMCLSSIGNSLILSGSTDETDCYLFCGWSVLVDVTSLTSFTLLFAIPTPNYVKLLGFTMDEISLPIVEVPGPHQLANSVQVFNISTQTLQNLGIQGVAGSFFIGQYKESLILLPYPDRELLRLLELWYKLMLPDITYYCWFWTTAKVKTVNGEHQIQALVDKKKVIIIETSIRSDLKLDDTEAWNEFSSTMASAIICLATNQKFNFSKYIFDNMIKNLEGGVKFLMYPRFVQVFLDKQVEGMSKHNGIYVIYSHTKKVFANMKREGKGFFGRVTPLFQSMMVQASEDMGEDSAVPTDSHSTPIITQPSSSKPQKKKSRRKQRKDSGLTELITETTYQEHVSAPSYDPPQSGEDRMQLHELMNLCTKLSDRVLALENANTSLAAEIAKLKEIIKKLEKKRRSRIYKYKRLYKVGSSKRAESFEESLGAQEDAFNQGRKIAAIDQDTEVTLVNKTEERNDEEMLFDVDDDLQGEEVAEKEISTADPVTTAGETLIEIKTAKPKAVTTDAITITIRPKAKGVVIEEPSETTTIKTITTRQPSSKDKGNGKMVKPKKPLKKKDQITLDEELEFRLHAKEQAELEREQRESDAQEEASRATVNTFVPMDSDVEKAKKQRIDKHVEEEKESEGLKQCLEIVPKDRDDVAIDATPLSTRSPNIADYKIYKEGKKSFF